MKDEELQKHTLNLYAGDYEELQSHYPDVGAGPVIRRLVRAYLSQINATGVADLNAAVEVKI